MNLLTLAAQKIKSAMMTARKSYVGLPYEPANLSASATVQTVQNALRSAENGDTRQLFALYRDLTLGGSHIQCEFAKRKMAVLSQPHSILPLDKDNAADLKAALAVAQMIDDCENWTDGLAHLLDATLWPVAAVEKLYQPADPDERDRRRNSVPLQFTLRRLHIINPTLFCFRKSYAAAAKAQGPRLKAQGQSGDPTLGPSALDLGPSDTWEPDLRFHLTDPEGRIDYSWDAAYPADPMRHLIHRGHLLPGVRDNWGGPMRSIVFWWLLAGLGRDWFARAMERYGSPFPVGKTDATNTEAMTFLQEAFSLSTKIGGLVVDNDTQVELIEAMTSGLADAHEKFLGVCNREISKVIIGQELSGTASPTGLGSGVANLQGEVRDDIRAFDQIRLADTLSRQLFTPFLALNGLPGRVKIVWGGLDSAEAKDTADILVSLNTAGLQPTDEAIPTISERVGFQLERKPEPAAPAPGFERSTFNVERSTLQQFAALPRLTHPSDAIATRKAAALADAYRGSLAPIRAIILNSTSAEEAKQRIALFFADWKPEKVHAITEEALQIAAAAGAAAASNVERSTFNVQRSEVPPLALTVNVTPSRSKKLIPQRDPRGLITHFDSIDTTESSTP